jgi:hypothetical protein
MFEGPRFCCNLADIVFRDLAYHSRNVVKSYPLTEAY